MSKSPGITSEQVIKIPVQASVMPILRAHAVAASIGGRSNVRRNAEDRKATLSEDQLIGQIGQYVGSMYLHGHMLPYMIARWYANRMPNVGDMGSDLPGAAVDFKASLMRNSQNPLDYRLLVRPREKHPNWLYVLILVEPLRKESTTAHVVGWATTDMLPPEPESGGPFYGAHMLKATALWPMPPIVWSWTK
jgi:hypothetical protein